MEYISSDTNVWLDFATINKLEIPFKLPYTYIMNDDAIEDELLSPKELRENLVGLGLQAVELTEEEFYLAEEYNQKYVKPSLYDCVALAIAKVRKIILLTGDGPLRKAAEKEKVTVIGTIGVLDRLLDGEYIEKEEYIYCINALLENNGKKVRLPERELLKRVENDGYLKNPAIEKRNPAIGDKNPAIEERNPSIQIEKLSIEKIIDM